MTFDWASATTLPTVIVSAARSQSAVTQSAWSGAHGDQDAEERAEGRRLRAGGDERRHRGRRPLVDVGRPLVEGHGRGLEPEPDQEERQAREDHRVAGRARRRQRRAEAREVGRARRAVEERDPVQEEAAGEGAEQEVLQRGLVALGPGPEGAGEDVEGQRHELEREEDDEEVRPGRHQHHADGGEEDQRVVLAGLHAEARQIARPTGAAPGRSPPPMTTFRKSAKPSTTSIPWKLAARAAPEEERHHHGAGHAEHAGGRRARPARAPRGVASRSRQAKHATVTMRTGVEGRPVEGREVPPSPRRRLPRARATPSTAGARLSRTTWSSSATAVSVTAVKGFG